MKTSFKTLYLTLVVLTFMSCSKEKTTSFTATINSWNYNNSTKSWEGEIFNTDINSNIFGTGAVLVYMQGLSSDKYFQLPFTYYESSQYSSTVNFYHYVTGIKIFWTDSDLVQPINPGPRTFKVILIPSESRIHNSNVDFSDYKQVEAFLETEKY